MNEVISMFNSVFLTPKAALILLPIFWTVILCIFISKLFEQNSVTKTPNRQIAFDDVMRETDAS